ncbi:hypothetical protein LCGC14_2688070 [marine sediment metagenome]|uniref:Uncharacterized protein n=1 Tax=marine sediment metagenome TaxID=412755 RepID=A0A0F9A6W1_9ZZZZ
MEKLQLHPKTLDEAIERWDAGRSLFSVEMGGLGPGYEQAIQILKKKRTKDGYWKLQNNHPGKLFFKIEGAGKPSRWNTLRALRILKWWEES